MYSYHQRTRFQRIGVPVIPFSWSSSQTCNRCVPTETLYILSTPCTMHNLLLAEHLRLMFLHKYKPDAPNTFILFQFVQSAIGKYLFSCRQVLSASTNNCVVVAYVTRRHTPHRFWLSLCLIESPESVEIQGGLCTPASYAHYTPVVT